MDRGAAGANAGSRRIARRKIRITAFPVRDGIVRRRSLAIESSRFGGRRQRLFFLEFWDLRGVGFWFRRFRRLFFIKTLGRVHGFALGNDRFLGHGNSSGTDQIYFRAAKVTTNATPASLSKLNKRRNNDHEGHAGVHDDRVDEELPETLVIVARAPDRIHRIGGGGHLY